MTAIGATTRTRQIENVYYVYVMWLTKVLYFHFPCELSVSYNKSFLFGPGMLTATKFKRKTKNSGFCAMGILIAPVVLRSKTDRYSIPLN